MIVASVIFEFRRDSSINQAGNSYVSQNQTGLYTFELSNIYI